MSNLIDQIQFWGLIYRDGGLFIFTAASAAIFSLHAICVFKNRQNLNLTSLYHYTTRKRLESIAGMKVITGGNHGVIFTTANEKYRNRGTSRKCRKTQKTESGGPARIVFTENALGLFHMKRRSWYSLLTGASFMAELNDEYVSRHKGNIKILAASLTASELIVTDAEPHPPSHVEKIYSMFNGKVISLQKSFVWVFHSITLMFLIDREVRCLFFELNWLLLFLGYMAVLFISMPVAECIYFLFRSRLPHG
ncbi:hypothetical protein [Pantoea ananatis]|uniref:hypothetical protein n=1 Tax=Pantoea ananas TaxID=553 RepID=UPI00157756A6|nr:hypothetical protein [Pantoea ananatis]NQE78269.1 hypothetical protein [Pantoea ananatis]NQE83733.1 hypothetical protein [Pantoea ananatis]